MRKLAAIVAPTLFFLFGAVMVQHTTSPQCSSACEDTPCAYYGDEPWERLCFGG